MANYNLYKQEGLYFSQDDDIPNEFNINDNKPSINYCNDTHFKPVSLNNRFYNLIIRKIVFQIHKSLSLEGGCNKLHN